MYTIKIRPSTSIYDKKKQIAFKNGVLKQKFYCVRTDGIREDIRDKKYIEPHIDCRTKVGMNDIYFDGNFSMLKDIKIYLFFKKDIYCFFGRRKCPAYYKSSYYL